MGIVEHEGMPPFGKNDFWEMKKGSLDNKAAHNSLIILMPGHILLVEAVYCKLKSNYGF